MTPPQAQRAMASRAGATNPSLPGSHAIYVANSQAVAEYVEDAANAKRENAGRK